MPSATYGRLAPPPSAGRLKLRPLVPHAADIAAAREASTPDQLAGEMADLLVAAFEARGVATVEDLERAGFAPAQIAQAADAAIALTRARLAARDYRLPERVA